MKPFGATRSENEGTPQDRGLVLARHHFGGEKWEARSPHLQILPRKGFVGISQGCLQNWMKNG